MVLDDPVRLFGYKRSQDSCSQLTVGERREHIPNVVNKSSNDQFLRFTRPMRPGRRLQAMLEPADLITTDRPVELFEMFQDPTWQPISKLLF